MLDFTHERLWADLAVACIVAVLAVTGAATVARQAGSEGRLARGRRAAASRGSRS